MFHFRFPIRFRGCLAPSMMFRYALADPVAGVPGTVGDVPVRSWSIRFRGCLAPSMMFRYALADPVSTVPGTDSYG